MRASTALRVLHQWVFISVQRPKDFFKLMGNGLNWLQPHTGPATFNGMGCPHKGIELRGFCMVANREQPIFEDLEEIRGFLEEDLVGSIDSGSRKGCHGNHTLRMGGRP